MNKEAYDDVMWGRLAVPISDNDLVEGVLYFAWRRADPRPFNLAPDEPIDKWWVAHKKEKAFIETELPIARMFLAAASPELRRRALEEARELCEREGAAWKALATDPGEEGTDSGRNVRASECSVLVDRISDLKEVRELPPVEDLLEEKLESRG